jgi:hypothetical protein
LPKAVRKYRVVDTTSTVTYCTTPKLGAAIYDEGQGLLMIKDGQEMVTWTGQRIGRFITPGKIRFTGSLFFSTSSTGKLAFLKSLSSPYLR